MYFGRLCGTNTLWMDGTFKCCPTIFKQIYTMHIKLFNQFFPVLMAFLPDKREVTYCRMFQLIKTAAVNANLVFAPQTVHIDFEMAVVNAVRVELNITATGCLSISVRVYTAKSKALVCSSITIRITPLVSGNGCGV